MRKVIPSVFLLVCLLAILSVANAQSLSQIKIRWVNLAAFPQVTTIIQILDGTGSPIVDYSEQDLIVEQDSSTQLRPRISPYDNGIIANIIVDDGAGMGTARWEKVDELVTSFATSYMEDSRDEVAMTAITASDYRSIVDYTSDREKLIDAVNNYNVDRSTTLSDPTESLETLIDDLTAKPASQGQQKLVVFITSGIEGGRNSDVQRIAEKAARENIPIFVFITREGGDAPADFRDANVLANETGGRYTVFSRTRDAQDAFEEISAFRKMYQLTYRATINESGRHRIQIRKDSTDIISAPKEFDITIEPAVVIIDEPSIGRVIERRAPSYTNDLNTITPIEETVRVRVQFPDGYERDIRSATLMAGNTEVARENNVDDAFELVWDLRSGQKVGESDIPLSVVVLDELGIESVSEVVDVRILVSVPERPSATNGQGTIVIVEPPTTVTRVITGVVITDTTTSVLPAPFDALEPYLPFVNIGLVVVLASLVGVLYFKREQVSTSVRNTIRKVRETLTQRAGGRAAIAHINVEEGARPQQIPLYGDVRIGRDRNTADIVFHEHEDSAVSRLHCTIFQRDGVFYIQDKGSSNGTSVNDVPLEAEVERRLYDEDQIELGRVVQRGILFRFSSVSRSSDDSGSGGSFGARTTMRIRRLTTRIGRGRDTSNGTSYEEDF